MVLLIILAPMDPILFFLQSQHLAEAVVVLAQALMVILAVQVEVHHTHHLE